MISNNALRRSLKKKSGCSQALITHNQTRADLKNSNTGHLSFKI